MYSSREKTISAAAIAISSPMSVTCDLRLHEMLCFQDIDRYEVPRPIFFAFFLLLVFS